VYGSRPSAPAPFSRPYRALLFSFCAVPALKFPATLKESLRDGIQADFQRLNCRILRLTYDASRNMLYA
jgi:hypothetical protein